METTLNVEILLTIPMEKIRALIQETEAREQSVGAFYQVLDATASMLETNITLAKAAGKTSLDYLPLSFDEALQRAQELRGLLRG